LPVDHSAARLMPDPDTKPIISSQAAGATPLGQFRSKVTCITCGTRPVRIEAACLWIKRIRHIGDLPRIDLSRLAGLDENPAA
jgi:hypothetical protein